MNKNPYASASQENKDEVIKQLTDENTRLRAALGEAREDIVSFGNHDWDCKANGAKPCTCWQQKAIDSIDEALKGQP